MKKVVLINGDRQSLTEWMDMLENNGVSNLYTASSTEDGLWTIERQKPAVIVLSARSEQVDGIQIARMLQSDESQLLVTPIIMVLPQEDDEEKVNAMNGLMEGLSFSAVLQEPLDFDVLLKKVREQTNPEYMELNREKELGFQAKIHLAIEDLEVAKVLQKVLELECYNVTITSKGDEAVDAIKKLHPHVVIAEDNLSQVNGMQIAKWSRKSMPNMLMFGLSDEPNGSQSVEMQREGALSIFKKPLDRQVLQEISESILEHLKKNISSKGKGGRTVLVVDDEEPIRNLLVQYLQFIEYDTQEASNGLEALEIIDMDQPDLVITDIYMPRMTGFQLLREIKRKMPSLPVVLITGYKSASKIMVSQNIQEDGFLEKPFQLEEVEKLINTIFSD